MYSTIPLISNAFLMASAGNTYTLQSSVNLQDTTVLQFNYYNCDCAHLIRERFLTNIVSE